jgi:hypothetical protein
LQSNNFKLTGRSGCELEILTDNKKYLVRKYSKNTEYNLRLITQANKQKDFNNYSVFFAPQVTNISVGLNKSYFDMEYVPGEKYSEYFLHCSILELNKVIENLISLINSELDQSRLMNLPVDKFLDKIELIKPLLKEKTDTNSSVSIILNYLETEIPSALIPVGPCHGDLTLSNVIFSNKKLFLVDFLDSFIETPLMDIVKLRQDTKFYWSLMIETEIPAHQKNKIIQILRYFDNVIDNYFKTKDYYNNWYNYLEKFNLLRILPYLEDKKEIDFVINALNNK